MGKRGPKPVDMGLLNVWEFEFYKAFHSLRDGTALPQRNLPPPSGLTQPQLRTILGRLRTMSAVEYWRATQHMAKKFGERVNLARPPVRVEIEWAQRTHQEEIFRLEHALSSSKRIQHQVERRGNWNELVHATTHSALEKACERWSRLSDVRARGLTPYPEHVLANASQFFAMKRNKRFPRSNYGDDARIDYLARGMAGAVLGVSPMTAIERLRNMKHKPEEGPLWNATEQRCRCWRCGLKESEKLSDLSQKWYENGLKVFLQIADEMKLKAS
jgi:hypothetical protein